MPTVDELQKEIDDLKFDLRSLEDENFRLEDEVEQLRLENNMYEQELYTVRHEGYLEEGVKRELAKFTFPEIERPELYDAWCLHQDSLK